MLVFPFLAPLNISLHSGIASAGKVEKALVPNLRGVHRDNEVLLGNQQI